MPHHPLSISLSLTFLFPDHIHYSFPFMLHPSDQLCLFLFLSLSLAEMLACFCFHPLFCFDFVIPLSTFPHLILPPSFSAFFFQFITFFDYPLLSSPFNTFISCSSPVIFHPISPCLLVVFLLGYFNSAPCVSVPLSIYVSLSLFQEFSSLRTSQPKLRHCGSLCMAFSLFFL